MNWFFFLKNKFINKFYLNKKVHSNYTLKASTKFEPTSFYINYYLMNLIFFFCSLYICRITSFDAESDYFSFTDFNLYNIYFWTFLNICFFWTLKHLNFNIQHSFKLDYLFVMINIFSFFCLLILANNLYTFLLILEICSYFFLYKLLFVNHFTALQRQTMRQFKQQSTLLFYHYWVSTFCTFLYFFFFLVLIRYYGSIYFGFISYLTKTLQNPYEEYFFTFFILIFIVCFCLKLGFSPFHLFKLQVYEGLSYFYLFFYTTYYFLGFFFVVAVLYFKLILLISHVISIKLIWITLFFIFIFSINLFQLSSFKQFLILSTIINLLNLFLILLLYVV